MGGMMKWMLIGCVGVLLLSLMWPLLGIQGYGSWFLFGLIFLGCLLPMLMMNKKRPKR